MITLTVRQPVSLFLIIASLTVAAAAEPDQAAGNGDNKTHVASQPINYDELQVKIASGSAKLAEARQALTDDNIGRLTNTLHALYSMRWHRGVMHLLGDMWEIKKEDYPEINWENIKEAPARIALASTLARIHYGDNREYLEYIRSHSHDDHEFHRAQAVVALGFNGDPEDVDYIKSMADGDNHYVAQSAITALSLMNRKAASDAMIALWQKHRGTPRGELLRELLRQAYDLVPTTKKPEEQALTQ